MCDLIKHGPCLSASVMDVGRIAHKETITRALIFNNNDDDDNNNNNNNNNNNRIGF